MNKILLVEDEKELAKAVKTILLLSKYEVVVRYNGKDALEISQKDKFDLIIMDVMMPVMDGITSLKEMRKTGIDTPVILLTAKSQIDDKVEGLDSGANDYLTKPFDKKELLARIRAILRIKEEQQKKYNVGNIYFDKEKSELTNKKTAYLLNDKESKIIEALFKNQNRAITEKELASKIWNNDHEAINAIPMYISYLQSKFNALDADVCISNKKGYMLEKKL